MAFAARVPTVIWQGALWGSSLPSASPYPRRMGEGGGRCLGAFSRQDAPSPSPFLARGPAPTKVRTCRRALCSEPLFPLFPFQRKPGCFLDNNTPAPLPSAQTQELPRAPRLQHQVGMHSLGSDMALGGHSEALETASG